MSYTIAMALAALPGVEDFIKKVIIERKSYKSVSEELRVANPSMRGLSSRSIRRFCTEHGIHATSRLTDSHLDRVVATSVAKVGHPMPPNTVFSCLTKIFM